MTEILLNHIPSSLLHILTAMILTHLFFYRHTMSYARRIGTIFLGGGLVMIIDVPKLIGNVSTHSLLLLPFTSLALALLTYKLLPFTFFRRWIGIALLLLIAGIGIDYLGNGAHLFYPINEHNLEYPLIKRDLWLLGGLVLLTLFSLSQKLYGWKWVVSGLMILCLLLGWKAYSKQQLQQTLDHRYSDEEVVRITTQPAAYVGYKWRFTVYTLNDVSYGEAIGGEITELHE
ncbi:hypothetical protein [Pontibacillus chungwhensis]|nr:hypothetical protein [Pontibacillus chungwhensis]